MIGDKPGADMGRLFLHLLHQPRTLDHLGKARVVLHIGGDGELAAGLDALDEDRLQHGARSIDRSRVAGRAGADDHELGVDGLPHIIPSEQPVQSNRCPQSTIGRRRRKTRAI